MYLLIIGIILILVATLFSFIFSDDKIMTGMAISGTMLFSVFSIGLWTQDKPTAIDVYRGKTTLKITYVDSVAVDSVVVFKEQ